MLYRERISIILGLTAAFVFTLITAYINAKKEFTIAQLQKHGFDKTIVVVPVNEPHRGSDATLFIAYHPTISDGISGFLANTSAAELLKLHSVEAIMPVVRTDRSIKLRGGESEHDISVFNITSAFAKNFSLGDPGLLQQGTYIPSKNFSEVYRTIPNSTLSATLTIAKTDYDNLPSELRDAINWSKAKIPVQVSNKFFNLPANSVLFKNALFTTGVETQVSIPGLNLIPTVSLFIKFKDSVDIDSSLSELATFFHNATPAYPGTHFMLIKMSDYFSQELGVTFVEQWEEQIRNSVILMFSVLIILMLVSRGKELRREIAIRRAIGCSVLQASWLSIRWILSAMLVGLTIGFSVGSAFAYTNFGILPFELLASVKSLMALFVVAVILSILMLGVFSRVQISRELLLR